MKQPVHLVELWYLSLVRERQAAREHSENKN
jgi:hypothetical protein